MTRYPACLFCLNNDHIDVFAYLRAAPSVEVLCRINPSPGTPAFFWLTKTTTIELRDGTIRTIVSSPLRGDGRALIGRGVIEATQPERLNKELVESFAQRVPPPGAESFDHETWHARSIEMLREKQHKRHARVRVLCVLDPADAITWESLGKHGSDLQARLPIGSGTTKPISDPQLVTDLDELIDHSRSLVPLASGDKTESRTLTRVDRTVSDFIRDPKVIQDTLARSQYRCEFPTCTAALFSRDDGTPYLEVHHITPLSRGGLDQIDNTAALCPACHRAVHHAKDRHNRAAALRRLRASTAP